MHLFCCSQDCFIPQDRESGRPRGFAFVTMASGSDQAIQSLNETEFQVGLGCIQYRCCCPDTQAALAWHSVFLRSDIEPSPAYLFHHHKLVLMHACSPAACHMSLQWQLLLIWDSTAAAHIS
jgi:hypothetical protein